MLTREGFLGPGFQRLTSAGGVDIVGGAEISVTLGANMLLTRAVLPEGYLHPLHNHPSHESMGVVVEGQLEMEIGGEVHRLGPGSTWHHPIGVYHSTRALTQAFICELHSPLRDDLIELARRQQQAIEQAERG